MSWQASEWAKKTRGHRNGSQKKVLYTLATEYNEKWGYAWISYEVLAGHCEMSKRNLRRHLKNLETDGYIELQRGTHHAATKFRLRMDQSPVVIPKPKRTPHNKTSPFQRPLEAGSQDDLRGVVDVPPEERSEVTRVTPQNSIRGDTGDLSEGSSVTKSGGTPVTFRGVTGDIELASNHARLPGINRVDVTPVGTFLELKKGDPEIIDEPLPKPGGNGCRQPGGNGRSGNSQQSSVFPGVITKGAQETETSDIGPAPPNPFRVYEQNIGPLTPILAEKIKDAEERYGAANIEEAIGIAVTQNKRSWAYTEGILRKWASEGRGPAGESSDQRDNRAKYLEDYVRARGHLPWETAPTGAHQEDSNHACDKERASLLEPDPEAQNQWRSVLDDLQLVLDKPTYETWLAQTSGVSFDDRRFVVEVPTPFAIAWLERRMYQDIQKTVQKVTGKLLDIQFQCSS